MRTPIVKPSPVVRSLRARGRVAAALACAATALGCGASSLPMLSSVPGLGPTPVSPAVTAIVTLGEYGTDVAVRADNARAYVPVRTNKVLVLDTAANQVMGKIQLTEQPYSIGLTPDGRRGYVMELLSRHLYVVDTQANQLITRLPFAMAANAPQFSPAVVVSRDGSTVYVTDDANDEVHVVDTATNTLTKSQFVQFNPADAAVSPDGRRLYVAGCKLNCVNGTLATFDAGTMQSTGSVEISSAPNALVLSPDGTRAYLTEGANAAVAVVDLASGTVTTVSVDAEPLALAADPQGRFIYIVGFGSSNMTVLDTTTNAVVATVNLGERGRSIAVAPDGAHAYVPLASPRAAVVDLRRIPGVTAPQ